MLHMNHDKHLRKAAPIVRSAETTAAISNTTICVTKPTTTTAGERRRRDAAIPDCVILPTSDAAYQNFQIIMVVILSCIFAVIFVIFYFCTKDLFLEIVGKIKIILKPKTSHPDE